MDREHELAGNELLGDNWPESWEIFLADEDELYEELEREA
jgi:hypothetical protein